MKDYEQNGSHHHCWNQKQPPACGMKGNHLRCCLCPAQNPLNTSVHPAPLSQTERECDNCQNLESGDIIQLDKNSQCIECGRLVGGHTQRRGCCEKCRMEQIAERYSRVFAKRPSLF